VERGVPRAQTTHPPRTGVIEVDRATPIAIQERGGEAKVRKRFFTERTDLPKFRQKETSGTYIVEKDAQHEVRPEKRKKIDATLHKGGKGSAKGRCQKWQ